MILINAASMHREYIVSVSIYGIVSYQPPQYRIIIDMSSRRSFGLEGRFYIYFILLWKSYKSTQK